MRVFDEKKLTYMYMYNYYFYFLTKVNINFNKILIISIISKTMKFEIYHFNRLNVLMLKQNCLLHNSLSPI